MKDLFGWLLEGLRLLLVEFLTHLQSIGRAVIETVVVAVVPLIPGLDLSSVQTVLAQMDYIVPLSETVAFGTAWSGVYISLIVYRVIKSWVPTLSGT
jgi:hypothetical protein